MQRSVTTMLRTYTADDEEPSYGRCDHINDSDIWCSKNCGSANYWQGYIRTEFEKDSDECE